MAYNILYETYVGADDYSLSLQHHGIKGQKWYRRRYQNPDGSLTAEGKIRYGSGESGTARPNLKETASNAFDAAKRTVGKAYDTAKVSVKKASAKHAEKKAEREEKERQKAILDGDVATILKYADRMSTNELNEVIKRADTMKRLRDLAYPDRKSAYERVTGTVKKITELYDTASKFKEARDKFNKSREEPESKEEKAYKTNLDKAVNDAMNKVRGQTKGSAADKERAAYTVMRDMYKAAETNPESYDKLQKALAKAEAAEKKQARRDARDEKSLAAMEKRAEKRRVKAAKRRERESAKRVRQLNRERFLSPGGWN